jgi:Transglycosylase SLT domain
MKGAIWLILLAGAVSASGYLFASDLAILQNGFSIRHERREVIGTSTRLYLDNGSSSYVDVPTTEIDHFEKDLTPGPAQSKPLPSVINEISGRHHLDPDLVNSVIHAESGFDPKAVSRKGAQGLMQLMPQTASKLGVDDAFDPGSNVEGGTRYLRSLLERYNFDLVKALAAYNAGPQRVEQYGGVPPYSETQAYVARIVRDFNRKKLAERAATRKTTAQHPKSHPPSASVKQASLPPSGQIVQR